MVLKAVFVLVLWNGLGSARGDYFSKVTMLSEHQTEQACDAALMDYGNKRIGEIPEGQKASPVVSCLKVSRMEIVGGKPRDQTWGEWWRTH